MVYSDDNTRVIHSCMEHLSMQNKRSCRSAWRQEFQLSRGRFEFHTGLNVQDSRSRSACIGNASSRGREERRVREMMRGKTLKPNGARIYVSCFALRQARRAEAFFALSSPEWSGGSFAWWFGLTYRFAFDWLKPEYYWHLWWFCIFRFSIAVSSITENSHAA